MHANVLSALTVGNQEMHENLIMTAEPMMLKLIDNNLGFVLISYQDWVPIWQSVCHS